MFYWQVKLPSSLSAIKKPIRVGCLSGKKGGINDMPSWHVTLRVPVEYDGDKNRYVHVGFFKPSSRAVDPSLSAIKKTHQRWVVFMAEREGFEPSMELLTPYSLSRGSAFSHSATSPKSLSIQFRANGNWLCWQSSHAPIQIRGMSPKRKRKVYLGCSQSQKKKLPPGGLIMNNKWTNVFSCFL